MIQHSLVTLNNTNEVRLTPNGVHSGIDITIQNVNSSGYVYIGGQGVSSTSYGYRILPNHAISFELPGTDAIYAISSAPDMKIAIINTNLESGS